MYLADTIDKVLESKKDKLVGRTSYYYIVDVLNRAFKNSEPFKFRFETYTDYGPDDYSVSGLYDMEKNVRNIILNFPKSHKYFTLPAKRWEEFKFSVSQVCQHESIHQCQWSFRNTDDWETEKPDFRNLEGNVEEDQEYLADPDEIEAYAHDIAMEIKFYYPSKNPYKVLQNASRHKKLWSFIYYKKTFKGTEWSLIRHKLVKKTYRWLPHV